MPSFQSLINNKDNGICTGCWLENGIVEAEIKRIEQKKPVLIETPATFKNRAGKERKKGRNQFGLCPFFCYLSSYLLKIPNRNLGVALTGP